MAPGPSLLALSSLPSRVCSSRAGRRAPASRHSPLTLLAAAFWRLPFGGDVPQPTSGERRPADHPPLGARTAKATPPLWRAHAETPPRCKPRPFPPGGSVVECRNSETRGLLLGEGGVLCSQLGEAPVSQDFSSFPMQEEGKEFCQLRKLRASPVCSSF